MFVCVSAHMAPNGALRQSLQARVRRTGSIRFLKMPSVCTVWELYAPQLLSCTKYDSKKYSCHVDLRFMRIIFSVRNPLPQGLLPQGRIHKLYKDGV